VTRIYMGLQEKLPWCWHLFSHVAIFCSLVTNFWPSTVCNKNGNRHLIRALVWCTI